MPHLPKVSRSDPWEPWVCWITWERGLKIANGIRIANPLTLKYNYPDYTVRPLRLPGCLNVKEGGRRVRKEDMMKEARLE